MLSGFGKGTRIGFWVVGSVRGSLEYERSWPDVFVSFCPIMRPRRSTLREWVRPRAISVGGAAAARDSSAATSWSGVGAGRRRFGGYGRGSRLIVSGAPEGPLRSAPFPRYLSGAGPPGVPGEYQGGPYARPDPPCRGRG